MAKYIERNELIKNLKCFAPEHYTELINALIMKQPAADVEPVKHGHWEWGDIYDDGDVCSACNYDSHREPCKYKYCPNCGAKMDGREKNDA